MLLLLRMLPRGESDEADQTAIMSSSRSEKSMNDDEEIVLRLGLGRGRGDARLPSSVLASTDRQP